MTTDPMDEIRTKIAEAAEQAAAVQAAGRDNRDIVIDQLAAALNAIRSICDVAIGSIQLLRSPQQQPANGQDPTEHRDGYHPGAVAIATMGDDGPRKLLCPVCGEVDR